MPNAELAGALRAWNDLGRLVYVPRTEEQYRRLVALLDELVDEVGEDETHVFASLMEVVGVLIERFEDEHVSELTGE